MSYMQGNAALAARTYRFLPAEGRRGAKRASKPRDPSLLARPFSLSLSFSSRPVTPRYMCLSCLPSLSLSLSLARSFVGAQEFTCMSLVRPPESPEVFPGQWGSLVVGSTFTSPALTKRKEKKVKEIEEG